MTTRVACNLILDSCGIIILLLILLFFFARKPKGDINRRKMSFLLYAAAVHVFVLATDLVESFAMLHPGTGQVAMICRSIAIALNVLSVAMIVICLLCDDKGSLHIPKGRQIPLAQIASAVVPSVLAVCLLIFLPGFHFVALAWAISLDLIHRLIMADSEKKLTEAEIRLGQMQAAHMAVQIQPHFLFNTLTSIESLCSTDPEAAGESIANLAGYLRANIDSLSSDELIPFDTEMKYIRQYIALEQADPSRRFSFEYELDARDFSLPALTVQPMVENAVKHGALTRRDGNGRVTLTTERIGQMIRIVVADNGTGMDNLTESQKEKKGIGIINTKMRLETQCSGSLNISSNEYGTTAVILIPCK